MPVGRTLEKRGVRPSPVAGVATFPGIFSDHFNRPDQALDASSAWTLVGAAPSGVFSVVGGAVNITGSGKTVPASVTAPDTGVLDHFAEMVVGRVGDLGTNAILPAIRMGADGSLVGARQTGNGYDIVSRTAGGTFALVNSLNITVAIGQLLRVWAIGDRAYLSVNGGAPVSGLMNGAAGVGTKPGLLVRSPANIATQYDNWRSGPGAG